MRTFVLTSPISGVKGKIFESMDASNSDLLVGEERRSLEVVTYLLR